MADAGPYITALHNSYDRLTAVLEPLDDDAIQGPSYDSEWTVAQVASHLGSQAEIFNAVLKAASTGAEPPGPDRFSEVWAVWDARSPREQVDHALTAGGDLLARLDGLSASDRDAFSVSVFGSEVDLAGLLGMVLAEHAIHTWDVAVAFDHTAEIAPDAVALLIDNLPGTVAHAAKPLAEGTSLPGPLDADGALAVATTEPERGFRLRLAPTASLTPADDPATLEAADSDTVESGGLALPAESLIRLVYGRLDLHHTPEELGDDPRLDVLRMAFPGF